jgi:aryl-alcohol dehydrogenase-like predicted oxidoreductase
MANLSESLPKRRIGDVQVSCVGLGCMPMSSEHMLDKREQAIQTIHRALDLGITLLDTANIYAPAWDQVGHNEALVAEALRTYSGEASLLDLMLTTKGGITRGPGETWGRNSSADALRAACEDSMQQLGVDVIDLYQHHRHDPSITYAEQMQALKALKDANLIRRIGLSNVNAQELKVALEDLGGPDDGGVVSVQNEYSPRYRGDADVLAMCTELGIAFLPWSPLGGSEQAHAVGAHYAAFAEVGKECGVSAQEVVLAWLLSLSPVMIPIPGATRPATVDSIVHSVSVTLTSEQCDRLSATVPQHGSMYPDDGPRSALR